MPGLEPGIHVFLLRPMTWMAGTSPAMTNLLNLRDEIMMNAPFKSTDEAAISFARRHIGPSPRDVQAMLEAVGATIVDALMDETLPASIRQTARRSISAARSARPRRWRT